MSPRIKTALALATALLLCACAPAGPESAPGDPSPAASDRAGRGGPVRDHAGFVDALRARGLTVQAGGPAQQPFLRGEGVQLRIGGAGVPAAEIQSYDYDQADLGADAAQAVAEDTAQIGPDGNPATTKITWVAPPHLYRAERLVVIYTGSEPKVQQLLSELLGPQFAGE
jgi:hypothetical protein